jgi:hypothetical protein
VNWRRKAVSDDKAQEFAAKLFGGGQQQQQEPEPDPRQQAGDLSPEMMADYREWYASQQPTPELTQEELILERQREAEKAGNATLASMLALDLKHLRLYESVFGDGARRPAAAPSIEVSNVSYVRQGPEPAGEPPPPEFDPAVYSKEGRKSGEPNG